MIANLKKEVRHVLENWPETRNSDIALTVRIWQEFYSTKITYADIGQPYVLLKDLYDLPREDNVKRIRAKFCEEGFIWAFPTDWKVAKARKVKENDWRAAMGYQQLPEEIIEFIYFEVGSNVHRIAPGNVEEFLKLNPNAKRL